jgi:hypothetical protein
VDFTLVIVDVAGATDWLVCRRLVGTGRSRIAVITGGRADHGRDRRWAIRCDWLLSRADCVHQARVASSPLDCIATDRGIELVAGAGRRPAAG